MNYLDCWINVATSLFAQALAGEPALSDALPKLKGLADFAEQFEADFRRIESVAETSLKLRVLDITRDNVRKAIRSAESAKALYESDLAADY